MLLWVLATGDADEDTLRRIAGGFYQLPDCCIGWFGRRVRNMFADAEALGSTQGRATLAVWLRGMSWSIYGAKKEHSSCRRLISGAGPARTFSMVARERLVECSRTVLIDKMSCEPRAAGESRRPSAAGQLAASVAQAARAGRQNPLCGTQVDAAAINFPVKDIHIATDVRSAMPMDALGLQAADGVQQLAPEDAHLAAGRGVSVPPCVGIQSDRGERS